MNQCMSVMSFTDSLTIKVGMLLGIFRKKSSDILLKWFKMTVAMNGGKAKFMIIMH